MTRTIAVRTGKVTVMAATVSNPRPCVSAITISTARNTVDTTFVQLIT